MAAPQGRIRYQQTAEALIFQIEGWATMVQSLPFRRFVEQSLGRSTRKLWVDLRQCTYIDSTFLGTLLFIKRASGRLEGAEFRLLSPSPQCACLFQQMGVTDVFQIQIWEEPTVTSWISLTKDSEDQPGLEHNVLQAHEELASLPGKAGEPFRAVVRCLARDMDKGQ
jgi:anti-sigma B factor antagonist